MSGSNIARGKRLFAGMYRPSPTLPSKFGGKGGWEIESGDGGGGGGEQGGEQGSGLPTWTRGGGGGGGGSGNPFGNGDWKLLMPHVQDTCLQEMLSGFGWGIANSAKLWGGDRWDEEYAKTQTSTMCEFYGAQLSAFLLRRMQDYQELPILEMVKTEDGAKLLLQQLDSDFRTSQEQDAQARASQRNSE